MASALRRAFTGAVAAAGISLSGCGFLFPELDIPVDAAEVEGVAGTLIATLFDGTKVYGGDQGMHCAGGAYRGGGSPAAEDAGKNDLKRAVDRAKDKIKDIDKQKGRCEGKRKALAGYDGQAGCQRQRYDQLLIQIATKPSASAEDWAEYDSLAPNCQAARAQELKDPCSNYNQDNGAAYRRLSEQLRRRHEALLDQFESCIDDRKKQASAGQPPSASGGGILIVPGWHTGYPPSSGKSTGSSTGTTTGTSTGSTEKGGSSRPSTHKPSAPAKPLYTPWKN